MCGTVSAKYISFDPYLFQAFIYNEELHCLKQALFGLERSRKRKWIFTKANKSPQLDCEVQASLPKSDPLFSAT